MQPYQPEKKGINIALILVPTIIILLAAAVVSAILLGWFTGEENGEPPNEPPVHNEQYPNGYENNNEYEPNGINGENGTNNNGITVTPTEEPQPPSHLTYMERYDRIVWLDATRGGTDAGISGVLDGRTLWEKDVALEIILKAYELFAESETGIKAILVRSTDVTIDSALRPSMWNGNADMVVSVRMNTFPDIPEVAGLQVDFLTDRADRVENNTSRINITDQQLAQILRGAVLAQTGARGRDSLTAQELNIFVLSEVPVALITAGFMSNEEELALLTDAEYQWSIAQGIYNGIVEAFRFPRVAAE